MIAALNGESDIAVGNVIGSNIANLLLILGATSLISPILIEDPGIFRPYVRGMLSFDYMVMFGFALACFAVCVRPHAQPHRKRVVPNRLRGVRAVIISAVTKPRDA